MEKNCPHREIRENQNLANITRSTFFHLRTLISVPAEYVLESRIFLFKRSPRGEGLGASVQKS